MPLLCAGTPLLRKSSLRSDREVCDDFVRSVDTSFAATLELGSQGAAVTRKLNELPCTVIKGEDVPTLVVLQREMGAVAPSEVNPISGSAIQSRICSIDATTCLIVALRDPYSGTTAMSHFDHGGEQVENGVAGMLNYFPPKPITTAGLLSVSRRDEIENLVQQWKGKRYVELYLLGSVKVDQFSAETLGSTLRCFADDQDTIFDVVLRGTCVWAQNVQSNGRTIIHRGLMIDAKTGNCLPVECDARRAYPAGRLRSLRCFDADNRSVSAITLMPGETVSTPAPADVIGKRRALQYVIMVRPFKFPEFGPLAARKPLSVYASMSTTPDMEPADFAETLKSAVVYGSLTSADKVFAPHPSNPRRPSPVAFQLCVGELLESDAEVLASIGESQPTPAGESSEAPREAPMAFSWVQISPARKADNASAPS